MLHSWRILHQKFLSPRTDHYLIRYLWMFLPPLIIGLSASNTMIKTSGESPVLNTLPLLYWTMYHNFTPLKLYGNTRYEWVLRLTKKYPCRISTPYDTCRTNKPKCMTQLNPQVLRKYQLHVDQQRFTRHVSSSSMSNML